MDSSVREKAIVSLFGIYCERLNTLDAQYLELISCQEEEDELKRIQEERLSIRNTIRQLEFKLKSLGY